MSAQTFTLHLTLPCMSGGSIDTEATAFQCFKEALA